MIHAKGYSLNVNSKSFWKFHGHGVCICFIIFFFGGGGGGGGLEIFWKKLFAWIIFCFAWPSLGCSKSGYDLVWVQPYVFWPTFLFSPFLCNPKLIQSFSAWTVLFTKAVYPTQNHIKQKTILRSFLFPPLSHFIPAFPVFNFFLYFSWE